MTNLVHRIITFGKSTKFLLLVLAIYSTLLLTVFLFWINKHCPLQDTFAKYTARTSFERPLLNGVAFAQRVFHHEREMFESQQGWVMNTMQREPAPPQVEYAPVIFSQDTVSYLARIDMMSGEVQLLLFDCSLYPLGGVSRALMPL
jgi:hypothetical protein